MEGKGNSWACISRWLTLLYRQFIDLPRNYHVTLSQMAWEVTGIGIGKMRNRPQHKCCRSHRALAKYSPIWDGHCRRPHYSWLAHQIYDSEKSSSPAFQWSPWFKGWGEERALSATRWQVEDGWLSLRFHLAKGHRWKAYVGFLGSLILVIARWSLEWSFILVVISSLDMISGFSPGHGTFL